MLSYSYFKYVRENLEAAPISEERKAILAFLENSANFKKMKELQHDFKSEDAQFDSLNGMMATINNADTFHAILNALSKFDFQHAITRAGMSLTLFFRGIFNNTMNFSYYALHFREEASAKMLALGYQNEALQLRQ